MTKKQIQKEKERIEKMWSDEGIIMHNWYCVRTADGRLDPFLPVKKVRKLYEKWKAKNYKKALKWLKRNE